MVLKLKRNTIIAALVTVTVTITSALPVMADTLSDKLKQEQKVLEQSTNTYNDIEGQIEDNEATVQKMDEQIGDMLDQINADKDRITSAQKDIGITQNEVVRAEEQLELDQQKFDNLLRNIYMSGLSGYLNVLLESESFSDFITRIELLSKIIEYDNKELAAIKAEKDELNNKKRALMDKKDQLVKLQSENQKKIEDLNSAKESQKNMIVQLKDKEKLYSDRVSQYQNMVSLTLKQIQSSKQPGKQAGQPLIASRGISINASGSDVVQYALQFLGVPYVYGGSTPAGFDCSGFTGYVYAHFGISLNRRARDQAHQGVPVSTDDIRSGDLVFFGNPAYHVGIYVGNGLFIHAPETGEVVKISPLRYMNLSGVRRVR